MILQDVVLVGGGHAHVHVVKMLGMKRLSGVRITLISKDVDTPYSGMLPGHIAGIYSREECHIDLHRLCRFSGVRMIHAQVCGVDVKRRLLLLSDGRPPLRYDILSLDIGISPKPLQFSTYNLENVMEHITPVKPIDNFSRRWDTIRERILAWADRKKHDNSRDVDEKKLELVVVGGGAGGIELCIAMYDRLHREIRKKGEDPSNILHVSIAQKGECLVRSHNKSVQRLLESEVTKKGIRIHFDAEVINVSESQSESGRTGSYLLHTKRGKTIAFDEAIWCTHACGQSWLFDTGLSTTDEGFVKVSDTLESINTPNVFACGDICDIQGYPRPKAGVFAVRAGPPLVSNIERRLRGDSLQPWQPQSQFLGIIRTGEGQAIASRGPLALHGKYLWTLKDYIDRKWMSMYTSDLVMTDEMIEAMMKKSIEEANDKHYSDLSVKNRRDVDSLLARADMRCGGCGSKVGSTVLSRALNRLKKWRKRQYGKEAIRDDILAGIGDDAAVIRPPNAPNVMVQTVDFFRSFIEDPFLFGQITAHHALSDSYAMNAKPLTALAICTVPFGREKETEDELVAMLAGAQVVFEKADCVLVGGHTCEATDKSLGFSITGVASPQLLLNKGPLPIGHAIILTKPLGTGALLAADMRARAKGAWIQQAIAEMIQSNADSATVLQRFGCLACTDVTGFGLMGHLLEMLNYNPSIDANSDSDSDYADADDDDTEETKDGNKMACRLVTKSGQAIVARLIVKNIPFLIGALKCVDNGVTSSLQPENLRSARVVSPSSGQCHALFGAAYQLLFDPQTSGGLLATIPQTAVANCLSALKDAGYKNAAVIGHVESVPTLQPYLVELM